MKRTISLTLFSAMSMALMLAAPASAEDEAGGDDSPDARPDARPDTRVGADVNNICFIRNIRNWREADGYPDAVLLERTLNDWYLVELTGACRSQDFRFALTIGLDSRPAGGCITRGDAILVRSGGGFVNRCLISDIKEWDEDAPAPHEEAAEVEAE